MSTVEDLELEYVNCNLCHQNSTVHFRQIGPWKIVQCIHCKLKYLNPRPTASQLAKLYSDSYFDTHFTLHNSEEEIQRRDNMVARYERMLGKKGSLLDVGCGYGFLVAAAQRQNWDAKGIDISEDAVAFGTKELGADLERATPETWCTDRTYDIVVSSHSLEHVPNPRETLKKLKSFMQPNESLLHISVPNIDSIDRRWHGENWWAWDLPFHFYFFEPKTLTELLKQVGFRDVVVHNWVFNPFSHLLADLQTGKPRNDGPGYLNGPTQERQGFSQHALYGISRVYGKAAHMLKLNRLLSDRDIHVWAKARVDKE